MEVLSESWSVFGGGYQWNLLQTNIWFHVCMDIREYLPQKPTIIQVYLLGRHLGATIIFPSVLLHDHFTSLHSVQRLWANDRGRSTFYNARAKVA